MIANGEAETFDMAYLDADKWNNPVYYEKCMELVRKGGLILLDDVSGMTGVAGLIVSRNIFFLPITQSLAFCVCV